MTALAIVESRLLDNDWANCKEIARWCGGTWLGSGGNGLAIQLPEKLIFAMEYFCIKCGAKRWKMKMCGKDPIKLA